VNLGIFDTIGECAKSVEEIASEINADVCLLKRLLRALTSLGLLRNDEQQRLSLTPSGSFLDEAHPETLKWMVLLEEGPEHYAVWKHLSNMVRSGVQNGFQLEYGQHAFDYAQHNPQYAEIFSNAMSSFSSVQSRQALEAFAIIDMTAKRTICDIAGGKGHLLSSILKEYGNMTGILFDLPEVVEEDAKFWAKKFDVERRLSALGGDMFKAIPAADDYVMKMILHDWNDAECIEILKKARAAANSAARLFIVEHVVPEDHDDHFSKLYDIHMLCWATGTERTVAEYQSLVNAAGWNYVGTHFSTTNAMGIIEASN
jgi:hypothetical protein